MDRLVYYSLALRDSEPRPDLVWQLAASVRTLREHNRDVPVALFVHGGLTPELASICAAGGVMVCEKPRYEAWLAALHPTAWPALAAYPLLHKFGHFAELAASGARQVLFCDCDTLFNGDVDALFERYGAPDLVAREEVHSSRSHHGADRAFVDEPLLARIAHAEGAAPVAPFNLGVVLLNHGLARRLAGIERLVLDYAWRFVTWMALNPARGEAAAFGEFRGLAEAARSIGPADAGRALPYPSVNRWILDEAALWVALGHVAGLSCGDFDRRDVAQNGEFAAADPASAEWVVCHYYSQNLRRVQAWLERRLAPIPA